MNKKLIGLIRLVVISLFLVTLAACATSGNRDNQLAEARAEARKAQQDASRALKAAEEAKAAAEAAKTEKERVDRMFEQTMKK